MGPKVVITSCVHSEVLALLERHGFVVDMNSSGEVWSEADLLRRVSDADALLAFMSEHVDDDFLRACPRLRIIAGALKGHDNFDVDACTRRGVWLSVVQDLLAAPTAELAVGLAIALARNMLEGDRLVREGGFSGWRPVLYGAGLSGAIFGIIGMGSIGRAIAQRLRGFEPGRVLYFDEKRADAMTESRLCIQQAAFSDVLAASDFLFLALPLTSATKHLFGREVLANVKYGCRLINPARGSLVDEEAVADALACGRLAGYAADVFEMEDRARGAERPQSPAERLRADRLRTVLTPHIGSAVDVTRRRIAVEAAWSILDWHQGKVPRGAVNRPRGVGRHNAELT